MTNENIIEIKRNIEQAILDQDRSHYFYIETCRLLEDILDCLSNYYGYFFGDNDTLLPKIKKICEDLKFDSQEKLLEIIKYRNKIIHEPSNAAVPFGRYDFLEYCQAYNKFISLLIEKLSNFPILYKIDENVFNIDLAVVNEDQKSKGFSASAALLKKDIEDRKNKLELLKRKGEICSRDYYHTQDLLLTSYKSIIPFYVDEYKTRERFNYQNVEFEYGIGLYDGDLGFIVKGITPEPICRNTDANCYSVIHSILTKNKLYQKSKFLSQFIEKNKFDYNEKYILRHQIIILSLIKNNVFTDKLIVNITDGTTEEFIAAFEDIKHYLEMLFVLTKREMPKLSYDINGKGIKISVKDNGGTIYCIDKSAKMDKSYLWLSDRRIFYSINNNDEEILNEFAFDIFGIKQLKTGQRDAIIKFLNSKENNLCLFPTGYGKSLIFYFVSFLSSGCSIIVNPTEALICDQERNLIEKHNISNVSTFKTEFYYDGIGFNSKIIYVSSEIFLNRSFVEKLAKQISENNVNNLILDEVHCLSIWGHDFKPDYIMFAEYLKEYFVTVKVLGFTATANTKVLYDLKNILSVKDSGIIESKSLKRADITVEAITVNNYSDIFLETGKLIDKEIESRWLTFVKNKEEGCKVSKNISKNHDECYDYKLDTYKDFVDGRNNILIVSHDMGIGINYPNINCCVHVGYPISINQFIQEVGRIAREDNSSGKAFVIAQDSNALNEIETKLLDINTPIEEILETVRPANKGESDIFDLYKTIFDYLEGSGQAVIRIIEIYDSINLLSTERGELYFCPITEDRYNRIVRFYLIILMQIGIISKWFYKGAKDNIGIYEIEKSKNWNKIPNIKETTINSIRNMGLSENVINKIKKAGTIKDVILIYIQWYYNDYLDNQREQLVNMVQAIDEQDLSSYFEINFADLEKVRHEIELLELHDFFIKKEFFFDKKSIAIAVKLSELQYNPKYDLFLLWSKGLNAKSDFSNRLERIIKHLGEDIIIQHYREFANLYKNCCNDNKRKLIEKILSIIGLNRVVFDFYDDFNENELDSNYYEFVTVLLNKKLEERK